MSYFRVNHSKDYTVMSNYHLKDKSLSLKAVGLLSKMLSLPDEWDYSVNGLVAICKENKTAVQSALKELEECGYLKRTKTQDASGRFDWIYDIYEKPFKEKPCTENPVMEIPCTENVSQLNTKESNTKESNTKNKKKVSKSAKRMNYDEQIEAYSDNEELRQALKAFIQMRGMIKKPLTNYALSLILNKLDKLANDDSTKTDIINQSVEHSWQGVFPLKDSNMADGRNANNQSKPEKKEYEMHYPEIFDFQAENGWDEEGYNKAVREYNEWLESSK